MFGLVAYALGCGVLHNLLSAHYADACRPSWWSFGLDPSAYCAALHRALHVLRAAPLLALPAVPRVRPA